MIDWPNLAANALWILGCALGLATLSYASWQASMHNEKLGARLSQPSIQAPLDLAGVLICSGMAANSSSVLWTVLWGIPGVLFVIRLFLQIRQIRSMAKG